MLIGLLSLGSGCAYRIALESEPGQGACFALTLDRAEGRRASATAAEPSALAGHACASTVPISAVITPIGTCAAVVSRPDIAAYHFGISVVRKSHINRKVAPLIKATGKRMR